MYVIKQGDIFQSQCQVLTNTINCSGVMGKGLALEFKHRYPKMFQDYKKRCSNGEVRPGEPYLYSNNSIRILNFPTKDRWQDSSKIEWIEKGLDKLLRYYND